MKRGFQFAAASKLAGAAGQRIGREESDAPSSEPTGSELEQSGLRVGEEFSQFEICTCVSEIECGTFAN